MGKIAANTQKAIIKSITRFKKQEYIILLIYLFISIFPFRILTFSFNTFAGFPAAIEQLRVLAEQIEVPMYSEPDSKNPVEIAQNAIKEAKAKGYDLVIVDTAGRLAVDEEMMNEIAAIKKAINPNEILL